MYALCIFLHLIEINFPLSPFVVPFLGIVSIKKAIFVLIYTPIEFTFPEMLSSLKINVSFLSSSSATSLASFPSFNDSSHIPSVQVDIIKPHLVYRRRLPVLAPSANVLPSAPLPPSVDFEVTDLPPLLPPLRRSSRVSIPPDRFGFNPSMTHISNTALSATLNSIDIPTSYSQATKEPCWQ